MLPKKVYDVTIAHYDRMIAWVKTQNPDGSPTTRRMLDAIGEYWKSDDCRCRLCDIGDECVGTPWIHMSHAKTWHTWLYWAYRERAFIRRLPHSDE